MTAYSVIRRGAGTGMNNIVDSVGQILDEVIDGIKQGETITICEIDSDSLPSYKDVRGILEPDLTQDE